MTNQEAETPADAAWSGGFVCGLLTSRYYALRHETGDAFFRAAAPTQTPEVVYTLMASMCRAALDQRLFETGWASLDHLLLCESKHELLSALALIPDHRLQ